MVASESNRSMIDGFGLLRWLVVGCYARRLVAARGSASDCASPGAEMTLKRRENSGTDSPSRTTGPKINRKEGGG